MSIQKTNDNIKKIARNGQGILDDVFKKHKFESIEAIVNEKNGVMISDKYIDGSSKLKIKCEKSHVFEILPGNITSGDHWCHTCRIEENPNSVMSMSNAKKNDLSGQCHTTNDEYKNRNSSIKWSCKNKHEITTVPGSAGIIKAFRCQLCTPYKTKNYVTLEEVQDVAKQNKGEFLSAEYTGYYNDHQWKCNNGHIFNSTLLLVQISIGLLYTVILFIILFLLFSLIYHQ